MQNAFMLHLYAALAEKERRPRKNPFRAWPLVERKARTVLDSGAGVTQQW
jgi:hypothetical protein